MTDLEELYKHYLSITNDKIAAALLVVAYSNQNKEQQSEYTIDPD